MCLVVYSWGVKTVKMQKLQNNQSNKNRTVMWGIRTQDLPLSNPVPLPTEPKAFCCFIPHLNVFKYF